jgi:CRISPR-associated protein Csd1
MLKQLADYAYSHGLEPEPGFKPKTVRWAMVFDIGNKFSGLTPLGDQSLKKNPGRNFQKCPDLSQSEMLRGKIKSHFLVDTVETIALYGPNLSEPKTIEKHEYFVSLLKKAGSVIPQLAQIAQKLEDMTLLEEIRGILQRGKALPTDKLTFMIGEEFPLDSSVWHVWWREFRNKLTEGEKSKNPIKENLMRCFVTGDLVPPLLIQPKIEKLADVGGQPSGDALVSFDKEAFRSYGLEQSANSALSEQASAAYRAGLNHLIKSNGYRLAGVKLVHWYKDNIPPADDPLNWLNEGTEQLEQNATELARKILAGIQKGERTELRGNYFYALTLSGAAGRVMVRDWMEGQFEKLSANIALWFEDLKSVRNDGQLSGKDPKFMAVLGVMVRTLDELPNPFITKMWQVAVRGEPIPYSAMSQTLQRVKIAIVQGDSLNPTGLGLIKAYHLRKYRKEGNDNMGQAIKPYLNEENPNPAYQCGRLMAVLADLQRTAQGDVGAGVVQRYYASASTTPSLVLGRLTRTSQYHLNKLDGGLAYWYENKISGIWSNLKDNIPRTLSLEDQSLFALGYYQQIANMRAKNTNNQNTKEGN